MRKLRALGSSAALLAVAALVANGCSVLAPQPDRSRFYTLVPAADVPGRTSPARGAGALVGRTIGIGPVQIPGYLDRHEIATRVSPTRLHYAPLDLWAEPLARNMTRVLQADVASLLGGARVVAWPWLGAVDDQVAVEVQRFEAGEPPGANLVARWTLRSGTGGAVLASGDTRVSRPIEGRGAAAEVAALSGALSQLAAEIASALRTTPPTDGAGSSAPAAAGASGAPGQGPP